MTGSLPTVILVEDHEMLRSILVRTFQSFGFAVTAVGDAEAALRVIDRDGCPSLLFSDVRMPGPLDGIALAREVRQRFPAARVVLQTGFAPGIDHSYTTIHKPFAAAELLAAMKQEGLTVASDVRTDGQ